MDERDKQTLAFDSDEFATIVDPSEGSESAEDELRNRRHQRERELPAGYMISDRYRVERLLGTGGMGVVYQVVDTELEEEAALKLLHHEFGDRPKHRKRLRREVRLARRVSHPNVCRVHDIGQHKGELYVTMELLRGPTLRHHLRQERSDSLNTAPFPRKLDTILQICAGLSAAHRSGVVHRDVKPDNVIIEDERAVLTDFGIADLANRGVDSFAGTLAYVAPEVVRGEVQDARVDVFSLAVLTFELLAGERPFLRESLAQVLRREKMRSLPANAVPLVVRGAVMDALRRALADEPDRRTESVERYAAELADAARGAAPMTEVSPVVESSISQSLSVVTATFDTGDVMSTESETLRRVATVVHFRRVVDDSSRDATISFAGLDTGSEPTWPDLDATMEEVERSIVDAGGAVIEASSDRLVAIFGAPIAFGDDVARGAQVGLAIAAQHTGTVGIDTGRVLVRRDHKGRLSATGSAVNRAASLARSATPGAALASSATARHLVGRVRTSAVAVSLSMSRAVRLEPDDQGAQELLARRAPFVGRSRELAKLEALIRTVCVERAPAWVAIVGTQGFGKSRLRIELIDRVRATRDVDWLIARASPLGERVPLSVLESASREWARAAAKGLRNDLRSAARAATRWLEERAQRRPLGLIIEDLHWADDVSLNVLFEVLSRLDGLPVAVVLFTRPTITTREPQWRERLRTASSRGLVLELGAVDRDAGAEIARFHAPSIDAAALELLLDRGDGQPYFIEELARDFQERRALGQGTADHLPETVEAVLQGRLDRLPPSLSAAACSASVIGRVFDRGALLEVTKLAEQELGSLSDDSVDDVLAELERRAIVIALPPEGLADERYAFKHALVRDVAYQQLSPRARRRAHLAVASYLSRAQATMTGPGSHAVLFGKAYHYDQAGHFDAAGQAYKAAGRRALELFAYDEAAKSLARALELGSTDDFPLWEDLGVARAECGLLESALEAFERALALVPASSVRAARLRRRIGSVLNQAGRHEEAIQHFAIGIDIAERALSRDDGDLRETAALLGAMGWVQGYVMDDNALGLELSERAVSILEGTPHQRELAKALSRLGGNYMRAGRWGDQLECNRRNLEIGEALADLDLQITANINLGVVYASTGDLTRSIEHTRRAISLAVRTGAVGSATLARSNLIGLRLDRGEGKDPQQNEELRAEIEEVIRLAAKLGHKRFVPEAMRHLVRLLLIRGDISAASTEVERAVKIAAEQKSPHEAALASRMVAEVRLAMYDGASETRRRELETEIETLLNHADRTLAGLDDYELARTQVIEARYRTVRGRPGDAEYSERLLIEARATFERLGAEGDLRELERRPDGVQ